MTDRKSGVRDARGRSAASPDHASRRRFLALVGAGGGAAAFSTLVAACGSGAEEGEEAQESVGPPEPATDLEIVNFALFLEYLEEGFYEQVINSGKIGDPQLGRLIRGVHQNEREHADVLAKLATQLGGTPVARPKPNFDRVIAGGQQRILDVASTVENLGAAAYLGQVTRIENNMILEAALSIHTVEARHGAAFNDIAGNGFRTGKPLVGSIPRGPLAEPMQREEVLQEAASFVKR